MRALAVLLTTLLFALAPAALRAQCEAGGQPGATLLFPYFEVDLTRPDGLTTLISINVDSPTPVMTRVIIWSDWAIPVLAFNVFLHPHDVQTINMRDVLNGLLPSTSGVELLTIPGCAQSGPGYPRPALNVTERAILAARLSGGGEGSGNICQSERYADGRVRGYITVDTVGECGGLAFQYVYQSTPLGAGYFDHTTAENVLWGDMMYVDPSESSAQGVEAVALRAFPTYGFNNNTFYGAYNGFDGSDHRSPLPTTWSSRYLNGGAFDGGTDFIVFRSVRGSSLGVPCGSRPRWYPLLGASLAAYDEDARRSFEIGTHDRFPLATQRVSASDLGVTAPFGRVEFGLSTPTGGATGAWVIPVMTASGRFSVDLNGQPLDTGCGRNPGH